MTITVATNNARIRYTATSGQTAFAIPFEFFENDEIYVYVAATTLVAADEKTQGTGSTHYAVSGGGGSTGTVTFVTGITESYIVTIVRDIPIERITDFTAGSTINRAALNTQLDTLTAMVGDLKDKSDRAIRLQPYDSEISLFLPTIANRAGKIFGFDTNGNLTADTSANFDITLDDVVTNTLTMSGNANSKINLTAVLDSQILTNGAVLNLKSTKGSNTADIKLDGSTTYGIDLNAGNKAIRLQDATLFSSTIESSGAATLSSVLTNTITSSGDFTLSSAAQGINIKPATSSTDFLATNGSQTIGVISSEGTAHLKWYQNSNNTLLKVVNPTGTRTLLLPDESGTIHSSGGTTTHSNITVSSDGKVQFRDADIYIQSGADGHLDLVADTEIHIAATTVNVDGLMDISGNLSVGGTFDVTGTIDFSDANITNVGLISLDKITNDGGAGITLDSSVGIVLDAGSGQIVFKDDNTTRLTVAINSGSTQSITSVAGLKLNSGTDITLKADGGQVYITDPSGNDNFQFNGAASPTLGIYQNSNVTNLGLVDPTATRTILFPDASDTLVGKATTDTLTNKTLTAPTLTGTTVVASLDISGDIDVDGTTNLDVVDIDGAVDMASTLQVDGVLTTTAAAVFNGGFGLPDSQKATFGGTGTGDLQIYHDGSNSYIDDADTGSLRIRSNRIRLEKYTGENMIEALSDGAVELYHNGTKKFETLAEGSQSTNNHSSTTLTDMSSNSTFKLMNASVGNNIYNALEFAGNQQSMFISAINHGTIGSRKLSFYIGSVGGDAASDNKLDMLDSGVDFNPAAANKDFRVRSDSNDNALFVDGGESHVCLNTATDHGGVLNVETTGNAVNMVLVCTDTDTLEGPIMDLTRDAGNVPGDGDLMGVIRFRNDNNNLAMQNYATISSTCTDVTDGTEDGKLTFNAMHGGNLVEFLRLEGTSNGIVFNDDRALLDFRVASGANNNMLFVDASTDRIGIGKSDPARTLDIHGSMEISVNTASHETFIFTTASANDAKFLMQNASSATTVVLQANGASYFNGGDLLVGKTSASVTTAGFEIVGGNVATITNSSGSVIQVNDGSAFKWQVNANGGVYNYQSNNVNLSDQREKKNIEALDAQWDAVKAWSVKEFHYNEDEDSDAKKVGVIAQDVETNHPNLITDFELTEDTPRKAVKEQQMMWMAIKALQEAQARIETLETKVAALEG